MSKKKKNESTVKISVLCALLVTFALLLATLKGNLQSNVYSYFAGDNLSEVPVYQHPSKPVPTVRKAYLPRK